MLPLLLNPMALQLDLEILPGYEVKKLQYAEWSSASHHRSGMHIACVCFKINLAGRTRRCSSRDEAIKLGHLMYLEQGSLKSLGLYTNNMHHVAFQKNILCWCCMIPFLWIKSGLTHRIKLAICSCHTGLLLGLKLASSTKPLMYALPNESVHCFSTP